MAERLSLIAGRGGLVAEVVAAAQRQGYELQLLTLGRSRNILGIRSIGVTPSDPQAAIDRIKSFGATRLAMAGGIRLSDAVREGLAQFARGGIRLGPLLMGDTALSELVHDLTRLTGARMVGVHEIAPELLAPKGLIAGPDLSALQQNSAAHALDLARRLGALDVGQGVVVAGHRTIATEDIAGTDALISRVRQYRRFRLTADGRADLVLAKAAKPEQPLFVDLPAIGPVTVAKARKAGIRIIAVQAGATLLIERARLADLANAGGVSILGVVAPDG